MLKKITTAAIGETKGRETLARADDVFAYIDSDFDNWGTDKHEGRKDSATLDVFEMEKDGTFEQLLGSLGKPADLALTQEQIIYFIKNHKDKLHADGYGTFFLFKAASEYFVAHVDVDSGDRLKVYVSRFSRGSVWDAELRRRIVVPQLAPLNPIPEPLTPSLSVPCPHCRRDVRIALSA